MAGCSLQRCKTVIKVIDSLKSLIDTIKAAVGYTPKTKEFLSDYDAVMSIAGQTLSAYAQVNAIPLVTQASQSTTTANSIKFAKIDANSSQNEKSNGYDESSATKPFDSLVNAIQRYRKFAIDSGVRPFRENQLPANNQLRSIAEAFGKRIIGFVVHPSLLESYGFFNGVTRLEPDIIYLRYDATRPHLALLGHELAHQLAKENTALYNELVDASVLMQKKSHK